MARITLDIIFENDQFIAVNKPPGVLTIPDRHDDTLPSLIKILEQKFGKLFIIHRLDKETSGIIFFAKDEATHKYFSQLFEHRNIQKYYQGVVMGNITPKKGTVQEPLDEHPFIKGMMSVQKKGKPSQTDYEVLEEYGQYSLVEFLLHTGRTHQIRVHMKFLGHPLACDEMYGNGSPVMLSSIKKKYKLSQHDEEERPILNRVALHSSKLIFKDSMGVQRELSAELPKDMRALLQQLRKKLGVL